MSETIRIVEVGPRDGLQNEAAMVPTATKIALIDKLIEAGHGTIELTSFVSPKWVPQMADAADVARHFADRTNLRLPVLAPNLQGLERALDCGVREVALFTAASDAFNKRNTNATIDESLQRFEPMMDLARSRDIKVRGYVSTVLGCPYQGDVPLSEVVRVARALHRLGCYEISLGDTIGVGTPRKARAMLRSVANEVPLSSLAVHFHDTRGQALANVFACVEAGVRVVDASVAGLGGCPYAQGASGNVATEDVVYALHGMGFETGIDLGKLVAAGRYICSEIQRSNGSKLALAWPE
ncbi:MAG: hydroxymethylglutaryl-CoA lyase [Ahniella sp.]|nr:hydroxymethylglutaryl-CoA lyase [Ahniella sp.]